MSAKEFEAALKTTDDKTASKLLYDLLRKGTVAQPAAIPAIAKEFLEAFRDDRHPVTRRRWIGLTLARLIEACPNIASQWRRASQDLAGLGGIILRSSEAEQTRIVAGLVIRAGLSRGIKFSDFWSEDRVHGTAKSFPEEASTYWMQGFQDYMDVLSHAASNDSTESDLVILYPVAFRSADGDKWMSREENVTILLIENQTLTIIAPASTLHEMNFIDVSMRSIKNVRCQPSETYDSQNRSEVDKPWEVVLEFAQSPTTYEVNCSERSGSDFTIIMQHRKDARECMNCINDTLHPGSLNESTSDPSAALNGDSDKNSNTARAVSRGGTVEFHKSQRGLDDSTTKSSQRTQQPASVPGESTQPRSGALPVVKSIPRSNDKTLNLNATHASLDSTSIKEPAPTQATKPPNNRKGATGTLSSLTDPADRKPAAPELKSRSQIVIEVDDDANDNNGSLGSKSPEGAQVESKSGLPQVTRPNRKKATMPERQQSNDFSIPEDDGKRPKRGSKRKRGKAVGYKGGSSFDDDGSESDYMEKKTNKPRGRPLKTGIKKEITSSSPVKNATSKRKPRQSKESTKPKQPAQGSLLSRLQQGTSKETQESRTTKPRSEVVSSQKTTAMCRKVQQTESVSVPANESLGSEAHSLAKLNASSEDENESNINQIQARTTNNGIESRKRPPSNDPPSTPPSKRAKRDHNKTAVDPQASELGMAIPPQMTASLRIFEDPGSPCGRQTYSGRPSGTMKTSSQQVIRDVTGIASPATLSRTVLAQKQTNQRQTPVHQLANRTHSGMSASLEVFSSNSKPTPASPRAASTAISGHADQFDVIMEKEQGRYSIEKNDPFRSDKRKGTEFIRRLTGDGTDSQEPVQEKGSSQKDPIELGDTSSSSPTHPPKNESPLSGTAHTGIIQPLEGLNVRSPTHARRARSRTVDTNATAVPAEAAVNHKMDMDGDTLVDFEESQLPGTKASPVQQFRSSPPLMDRSPSSHSSTSVDSEPKTEPPARTSEAEENEWEASLLPHQRNLKDQLFRVSNRILRHVVDSESAVNEIVDSYAEDGQRALQLLLDNHKQEFDGVRKDMNQKKAKIDKASEKLLKKIRKDRQEIENENDDA